MVQLKSNSQTISWFWDLYKRGRRDMNPSYQRRSVWSVCAILNESRALEQK